MVLSALVIFAVNGLLSIKGVRKLVTSGLVFFLLTGDSHLAPNEGIYCMMSGLIVFYLVLLFSLSLNEFKEAPLLFGVF